MRTYDKLIATILLAKARDGLRSRFGCRFCGLPSQAPRR
jgi:hypothetical protein